MIRARAAWRPEVRHAVRLSPLPRDAARAVSEASREVAQSWVRLLCCYRTVLPADHLTVDPLDCEDWGNSTRRARG